MLKAYKKVSPVVCKSPLVVFVGTLDELFAYSHFIQKFIDEDWLSVTVNTISDAKLIEDADALIIFSYKGTFVNQIKTWKNRPRTIWIYTPGFDEIPCETGIEKLALTSISANSLFLFVNNIVQK